MNHPSQLTGLNIETVLLTRAVIINAQVGPLRPICPESLGPASLPSGLILGGNKARSSRLLDIYTLPAAEITKEQSVQSRGIDLKALERIMNEAPVNGNSGATQAAVKDFSRSSDGFISNHFIPVDAKQELIRPVVLIRNPTPDSFEALLGESMHGSPLIVDDGNLIERALSGRMDVKWKKMLASITQGISGYHGRFEYPFKVTRSGLDEFRRFGFVGLCDNTQALLQSDRPEAQALARACLVYEAKKGECSAGMSNWYTMYSRAIRRIIQARRHGGNLGVNIDAPQAKQILALESDLLESVPQASLLPRMFVYAALLQKLDAKDLLKNSLGWAKRIAESFPEVVSAEELQLGAKKEKLLGHIASHGPCTWSTVARHYNVQKKECHQDALNALIAEGSITVDDQGLFQAKSVA